MFGVTIAVLLWIHKFKNRKIFLFVDNESVKNMINHSTSSCSNLMLLIRLIVLESMVQNVRVYAKYVKSKGNAKADAISRLQFNRFRELDQDMNLEPDPIPEQIWPLEKIWLS